ncbi:type II toxin-antitoxin system RelB family antitoxin [Leucobacter sp. Z1108]|uniref:type II toxin-antitoxin system RelB family antitoxin n=1 Tax=Leucobacter sp. Z1108 TaxID=3439066 RepID=UPI003F38F71A
MSDTISLRLPAELSERLSRLAALTHRPKSFYVREALEEHLSDLEWAYTLADEAAVIRRGEIETRPLDELTRELGFDPDELRAEARGNIAV